MESICIQTALLCQSPFQITNLLTYSKQHFVYINYCNKTEHCDRPVLCYRLKAFDSGFDTHSVFKLLTGLASAVLMLWKLTVSSVMSITPRAVAANIHQESPD